MAHLDKHRGNHGIEVIRRLKADVDLAGIPVVVLTGLSNPEIRRVAFKVGAVDYIEKPFTAPVVHRQLKRMTYKLGLTEPSEV